MEFRSPSRTGVPSHCTTLALAQAVALSSAKGLSRCTVEPESDAFSHRGVRARVLGSIRRRHLIDRRGAGVSVPDTERQRDWVTALGFAVAVG
jgi:hypothetical protein